MDETLKTALNTLNIEYYRMSYNSIRLKLETLLENVYNEDLITCILINKTYNEFMEFYTQYLDVNNKHNLITN